MPAKFTRSNRSFMDSKPTNNRPDNIKLTDIVQTLDWPTKGKAARLRFIGPTVGRGTHQIAVTKKDGAKVNISKTCLAYDPDTDERDATKKCPYCKLPSELAKFGKAYFSNVIDRRLQEEAPAKKKKPTAEEIKTGFKSIDSDSFTPVRVVRVPGGVAYRLKQLSEKNIVKNTKTGDKKPFPLNHPKFGFDVEMSFDKTQDAAKMYSCDRDNESRYTPITEDEDNYLLWNIEQVYLPEDLETAKKEAEGLLKRSGIKDEAEDDDEDDDDDVPAKGKKSAKKSKVVDEDDDDDDDEDDDDDDDDGDDDDEPVLPKRGAKKSKSKSAADEDDDEDDDDDDDDEEDDDDEDEDDEDDVPVSKKSAKKPLPAKKGKKVVDDDDEDEDDDEDDEDGDDDEDDAPPPKKSVKKPLPAKKAKAVVDDDDENDDDDEDEDDDDDDEDDEDDEPVVKKSSKKPAAKAAPAKKGKKVVDEDDDDEDDLDEDDDDEEDEPPAKKPVKKSAPAKVAAKKKKSSR